MPVKADRRPVTVAFSGGKDSTAAILLLREQGHDIRALTMRLGLAGEDERLSRIENLARVLDVPWRVCDVRRAFREKVLDPFIDAYRAGLTPNPCVLCNRHVKFGLLLAAAKKSARGGLFASGHYADKVCQDNRWFLREPADRRKSQIYFLAMIEPAAAGKSPVPDRRPHGRPGPYKGGRAAAGEHGGEPGRVFPAGAEPGLLPRPAHPGMFCRRRHPRRGREKNRPPRRGRSILPPASAAAPARFRPQALCRQPRPGGNTVTLGDESDLLSAAVTVGRPGLLAAAAGRRKPVGQGPLPASRPRGRDPRGLADPHPRRFQKAGTRGDGRPVRRLLRR